MLHQEPTVALSLSPIARAISDALQDAGRRIGAATSVYTASTLKSDGSIVTETDALVEALVRRQLESLALDAAFIGEERTDLVSHQFVETVRSKPLAWAVDPLDGTTNFSQGLSAVGVSVGLMARDENGMRPVAGGIHYPAVSTSVLFDGNEMWIERPDGHRSRLSPTPPPLSIDRPIFLVGDSFVRGELGFAALAERFTPRAQGSTALDFYCAATGQIGALLTQSHIWDFAAGWGLLHNRNFSAYRVNSTGLAPLEAVDVDDFHLNPSAPWLMRQPILFLHPALAASAKIIEEAVYSGFANVSPRQTRS